MKYFNLLMLSLSFFFLTSCGSHLMNLSNQKQIDKRLVGTWVGSEKDDQIDGMEKSWEMKRNADGTFVLDFRFNVDGKIQHSMENGSWWIENGKFHEFHEYSGKTDLYRYEVLDKNQIKFSAETINIAMNTEEYSFIDTRKKDNIKDGSSFDKAIKVNSVSEEYDFIKSNCTGCKVMSQSLSEHKGNMFDIINVKKPDGSIHSYYFDIKSFFGKF